MIRELGSDYELDNKSSQIEYAFLILVDICGKNGCTLKFLTICNFSYRTWTSYRKKKQ